MQTRRTATAAGAPPSSAPTAGLLSILLPTYNERENLPIVVWLIERELTRR